MWLGEEYNYLPEYKVCLCCYVSVHKKYDTHIHFKNKLLSFRYDKEEILLLLTKLCQSTEGFITISSIESRDD